MYVPDHFRLPEERLEQILASPRAGNLVTTHEDGPRATLVPFHLETGDSGRVLVTHLVRNNPQAMTAAIGPALVILDVTDAYVSPLWYATNDVQPNVPTWDYLTVHVWGRLQICPDPAAALEAARTLTGRMEDEDVLGLVGEDKLTSMSRAIVAVEVEVDRVQGKAKMSQNRHPDDVRSLIERFDEHGQAEVADYLREVSLPYAEQRFARLQRLGGSRVPAHRQGGSLADPARDTRA